MPVVNDIMIAAIRAAVLFLNMAIKFKHSLTGLVKG